MTAADVPAVRASDVLDALDPVHPEHVLPELVVVAQDLFADHALQGPRAVDVVEVLHARALVGQELVTELAVHPPVGQGDEALVVHQVCNDAAAVNQLELRASCIYIILYSEFVLDILCINQLLFGISLLSKEKIVTKFHLKS